MEETKEMQDAGENVTMTDEEYGKVLDELKELRELENMKAFLQAENGRLKSQIEFVTGELEGMNITTFSAEANRTIYENRRKKSSKNIETLEIERDSVTEEINDLHLQIKATTEDEEASSNLQMSMQDELSNIEAEKGIVIKRLNDIKAGLQRISGDQEVKLPHLKGYDSVLRQMRLRFKEAQDRMEVSLMLRQR